MRSQKVMPYTCARQAVIAVLLVIKTTFAFSTAFTVYCSDSTTIKKLGKFHIALRPSQVIILFDTSLFPKADTKITPVAGLPLLATMHSPPSVQYFATDKTEDLSLSFNIIYKWEFSAISVMSFLVSNEPQDSGVSFSHIVIDHPGGSSQFSGATTYTTAPQSLWTLLYRLLKQSEHTFQNSKYHGVQVFDHLIAHSATGKHFFDGRVYHIPTEWTIQSITHAEHMIKILFEPDIGKIIPELTMEFDDALEGRSTVSRIKRIQYKFDGHLVVSIIRDEMNVAQVPPPCQPPEQAVVQSHQYPPPPPPGAGGVTAFMPFVIASGLVASKANQ